MVSVTFISGAAKASNLRASSECNREQMNNLACWIHLNLFHHLNFGVCATWIQVVDKRAQQPLQLALTLKELSVAGHDSPLVSVMVSQVGNG